MGGDGVSVYTIFGVKSSCLRNDIHMYSAFVKMLQMGFIIGNSADINKENVLEMMNEEKKVEKYVSREITDEEKQFIQKLKLNDVDHIMFETIILPILIKESQIRKECLDILKKTIENIVWNDPDDKLSRDIHENYNPDCFDNDRSYHKEKNTDDLNRFFEEMVKFFMIDTDMKNYDIFSFSDATFISSKIIWSDSIYGSDSSYGKIDFIPDESLNLKTKYLTAIFLTQLGRLESNTDITPSIYTLLLGFEDQ